MSLIYCGGVLVVFVSCVCVLIVVDPWSGGAVLIDCGRLQIKYLQVQVLVGVECVMFHGCLVYVMHVCELFFK